MSGLRRGKRKSWARKEEPQKFPIFSVSELSGGGKGGKGKSPVSKASF